MQLPGQPEVVATAALLRREGDERKLPILELIFKFLPVGCHRPPGFANSAAYHILGVDRPVFYIME